MNWHPIVVHFPVALVISATALLWAARLLRGMRHAATLATVGTWNLCLGSAAAMAALGTGLAAVIGLHVDAAAHLAISTHVRWAFVSGLLLVLLSVWRGAGAAADSRPSWPFVVLLSAAALCLMITAYLGGENVYRHGIGVIGPQTRGSGPATACDRRAAGCP
jgi:uncharacterized membrane protein